MTGNYRSSNTKNKSRFYLLLSVVFVIVVFKWGLPLFINIISGPEKIATDTAYDDGLPPQVPSLSALPEATNSGLIKIEGYTETEATTELYINDVLSETKMVDDTGYFVFEAKLSEESNRIYVKAKDKNNLSSQSPVSVVTLDKKPVKLVIITPKDGNEYYGTNNQTIDVTGTINKPGTTVLVNESYAIVDKGGSFAQRIMLSNGENKLTIKAIDKAGNVSEVVLSVNFLP